MNKKLLILMACGLSMTAFSAQAQDVEVGSIDEIINMQQSATENTLTDKHFEQVWNRKSFLNISYNNASLEPKETIFPKKSSPDKWEYIGTGSTSVYDRGHAVKYKSDWGLSLVYGRNYSLVKKPIANIFLVNLDYIPLDLNANHYKAEKDGKGIYNSDDKYEYTVNQTYNQVESFNYVPWNYEKYEFNYGMMLGPSLTFAPFTYVNVKGLHFVKFNVYYHIGYHASLLLFKNSDNGDMGTNQTTKELIEKSAKLEFGHGLIQSIGFNVSWKSIGIGYEGRFGSARYLSIDSENFGKAQYKFGTSTGRVYLQIRL